MIVKSGCVGSSDYCSDLCVLLDLVWACDIFIMLCLFVKMSNYI